MVSENGDNVTLHVAPTLVTPVGLSVAVPVTVSLLCTSSNAAEIALSVEGDGSGGSDSVAFLLTSGDGATVSPVVVDVVLIGQPDADNSDGPQSVEVTCTGSAVDAAGVVWENGTASVSAWNRCVTAARVVASF